ncbi:hypothetical protein IVA94_39050 [Bradyrhizobium sp. 156]|uniref:hypothetical protein n=1 Tax=Bradyrhizobium sp. 156 TaxID=2782630 RepID=UPI001FF8CEF1|nr:hypothetical protein [Bradyrhizobium sp. 156]MCK1326659.1 hypothetical protein [Bradyrhizobium sp. 156]
MTAARGYGLDSIRHKINLDQSTNLHLNSSWIAIIVTEHLKQRMCQLAVDKLFVEKQRTSRCVDGVFTSYCWAWDIDVLDMTQLSIFKRLFAE